MEQPFKPRSKILVKVWERIQAGYSTAKVIANCEQCGGNVLDGLDLKEVKLYMQWLVSACGKCGALNQNIPFEQVLTTHPPCQKCGQPFYGKAEWRPQGGNYQVATPTMLCVQGDEVSGEQFSGLFRKDDSDGEEHY